MGYKNKVNKQGLTEEEFLKNYNNEKYEKPSVTADILIFTVFDDKKSIDSNLPHKSLRLLMIKRGDHPCIGQWALPGGFVNMDESVDDAARRELKEETDIDDIYLEQLYTWGDPGRDPRTRIISTSYISLADSSQLAVKAGDDADDAMWFDVSYKLSGESRENTEYGYIYKVSYELALSNGEEKLTANVINIKEKTAKGLKVKREIENVDGIAFDHAKIISYGVEWLRDKAVNTDIVFNLMPQEFILSDLQKTYECILDKELTETDFKSKLIKMVK
ncbi:MAG: NUDIX hydrolase [Bacillota bacterium]|nr:NUDIX hydrolase [Bacillota bacterium]